MTYAFVPFAEIFAWAARGWIVVNDMPGNHGRYSVMMRKDQAPAELLLPGLDCGGALRQDENV